MYIYSTVSNIEAIQSQLKNIYTNTLSTLCPLPWLEKAEDVQYNFDDVFIPLRTIDIDIQQKTDGRLRKTKKKFGARRQTKHQLKRYDAILWTINNLRI